MLNNPTNPRGLSKYSIPHTQITSTKKKKVDTLFSLKKRKKKYKIQEQKHIF